jgi:hypothetical protein
MASNDEYIADLRELRDAYLAAEKAVLRNQSYEMPDGRKLTRANLKDIRVGRREAQADLDRAEGCTRARGRIRGGVPLVR